MPREEFEDEGSSERDEPDDENFKLDASGHPTHTSSSDHGDAAGGSLTSRCWAGEWRAVK